MYKEIISKIRPELDKVVSFLERETSKIHTGRATPSLVENIVVDYLGQKFPLKQMAAISVPEARQILIQPWDKSYLEGITRALEKSGVGANPIIDKDAIKINLPPLTEEYRKSLNKLLSEKKEQARETVRKWRDESWDEIQQRFKEGKVREDDKFKGKEELQELVDEYNTKIEDLVERKQKEIME